MHCLPALSGGRPMWNQQGQMASTRRGDLVAGLFFDEVSARDAIADLNIAGFRSGQVGVALSELGKLELMKSLDAKGMPCDLQGKHSIWWKLRHSFEHDLHSHGAGLSSTQDVAAAKGEATPYTEIDLNDTLRGLEVAPATIKLLDREIGASGMLILVDAGDRTDEAESILERNRGMSRTVMATEKSHITS
jgi:hypothetical protein